MNINTNILKNFLTVPDNLVELTNKYIIEVDEVKALHTATNLVIGHVLTCENHPDSDHLHVTTVDVGTEVLSIVCGAPNVAAGQYVIVAKVGAILPGNFEIKDAKIRGVASFGMICSLKELGFDEKNIPALYASGIYYFEQAQTPGESALKVLGLEGMLITLGLTPNRGDLLSHYGFALDLSAVLNQKLTTPQFNIKEIGTKNPLSIDIEAEACLRYDARVLDVTIKESPWWLKSALIASGIRPINNVVDITNYVLIEYGTPLHAFDKHKVMTDVILVKMAEEGQVVVTLDEEKRSLTKQDLLITNGKEAIAIAGVMGLLNTIVDENTKTIILEAACFDETTVQKTVKRLGLRSESSLRFERGVDDKRVRLGLERATALLIELADAKVYQGIASKVKNQRKNPTVFIAKSYFTKRLGQTLKQSDITHIFDRLNYTYELTENGYLVTGPSYRLDLNIAADFLEEVGRIYGLDDIKNKPLQIKQVGQLTNRQHRLRSLRHKLADFGLNETINYSLISDQEINSYDKIGDTVSVLKPMSESHKNIRQSLLPGLVQTASYNANRGLKDIFIYELGAVYAKEVTEYHVAVLLSGTFVESHYLKQNVTVDINFLKGLLVQIGDVFDETFTLSQTEKPYLHPGLAADIKLGDKVMGTIGKLHPTLAKEQGLKEAYVLELSLDTHLDKSYDVLNYQPLSKFPSVTRDLSFVISKQYTIKEVADLIHQTARKLITSVDLIDVYEGNNILEGHHSLAFSMTFNDATKTLETGDVDKAIKSIKNRLQFTFKAEIRE